MRWRMLRPVTAVLATALLAGAGPASAQDAPPDSVFARADRLLRAGRPDSVLVLVAPLHERAVAAGDSALVLRTWLHRAGALALSGRPREAEAAALAARRLAEQGGEPGAAQLADRWRGYALLAQGRADEAASVYTELRAAAGAAGNRREQAYAEMGLAYLALGRGETAAAREGYERAVPLFDAVGERAMALDCLVGLARTLGREGRYAEMRDLYARILREAEAAGLARVAGFALNNLGSYEYQAGDPGLAVTYWEKVVAARMLGGDAVAVTPRLNLAVARMAMGSFDEAAAELRDLEDRCMSAGLGGQLPGVLAQRAALELARGDEAAAAAAWRRLMTMPEADQEERLEAALDLARSLARRGDPAASLALCDSLAGVALAGAPPSQRAGLDLARATALAALDRPAEALAPAARARETVRGTGWRQTEMGALLVLARAERALAAADPAADRADSALAHLEAARRRWEDLRTAPRDPQWREQRGALGSSIHLDLAGLLLEHPAAAPAADRARAAFDALQGYKARTLLERMLGPDAFRADSLPSTSPTLADLQRGTIAPDEVLLDYYLGDEASLLLVATRGTCRAVPLPGRAVLRDQVQLFLDLVSVPPAAGAGAPDFRPAARRLAATLLQPAAAELRGAARIVLAADGLLNRLPFELLPLDAAAEPFAPLGDVREVVRVPSATVLLRLRAAPPAGRARGVLVLESADAGGPDALPGAAAEVRSLRRRYAGTAVARPGCAAPDGSWADGLAGHGALHVPAHTETFDQRPWQSRIALGRDEHGETCWLTSADVARLSLEPGLAVLSGCSSAGGRALSGEGVLGLTGAFLAAGSRAVVASLWDVDDGAAAAFMECFYAGLAEGRTTAGALAAARAELAQVPALAAPSHWAGFVVVGDGRLQVPLERRGWRPVEVVGLAASLAGIAVGLVQVRRRRRVIFRRGVSLP